MQQHVLHAGGGAAYSSISQALAAAPEGATIRVAPGMYAERLVISKRVDIMADPGGPVTVSWSTSEPYQSTIDSCGKHGARVRGLTIRHRSPSVANNYAVFLQGSDLALEDCDVSSATGSGLGIEGGSPAVVRCTVHDCERHGIAIFSELGGSAGGGRIEGCRIASNKLDGVLVRDGADPMVTSNVILQNGGHGASLKGCTGRYSGNKLSGNGKGSVLVDALADVDIDEVESQNAFDKPITLL